MGASFVKDNSNFCKKIFDVFSVTREVALQKLLYLWVPGGVARVISSAAF